MAISISRLSETPILTSSLIPSTICVLIISLICLTKFNIPKVLSSNNLLWVFSLICCKYLFASSARLICSSKIFFCSCNSLDCLVAIAQASSRENTLLPSGVVIFTNLSNTNLSLTLVPVSPPNTPIRTSPIWSSILKTSPRNDGATLSIVPVTAAIAVANICVSNCRISDGEEAKVTLEAKSNLNWALAWACSTFCIVTAVRFPMSVKNFKAELNLENCICCDCIWRFNFPVWSTPTRFSSFWELIKAFWVINNRWYILNGLFNNLKSFNIFICLWSSKRCNRARFCGLFSTLDLNSSAFSSISTRWFLISISFIITAESRSIMSDRRWDSSAILPTRICPTSDKGEKASLIFLITVSGSFCSKSIKPSSLPLSLYIFRTTLFIVLVIKSESKPAPADFTLSKNCLSASPSGVRFLILFLNDITKLGKSWTNRADDSISLYNLSPIEDVAPNVPLNKGFLLISLSIIS